MRKKSLVVGMVMVMSAAMLTACGSSKEDYIADVTEISEFSEAVESVFESMDMDEYDKALDEMDMKTKEGKVVKEDFEEMGDLLSEMLDMAEDWENYDEDKANELDEKLTDLSEKAEDDFDAFEKAAKDSGVEDEDLEDLNLGF